MKKQYVLSNPFKSKQAIITHLIGTVIWLLKKLRKKSLPQRFCIKKVFDLEFNALNFSRTAYNDLKQSRSQYQQTNATNNKKKNKRKKKKGKNQKIQSQENIVQAITVDKRQGRLIKIESNKKNSDQKRQSIFKAFESQQQQIVKKQHDSRQKITAYYKKKTVRGKIQQRKRQLYLYPRVYNDKEPIQRKKQRQKLRQNNIRQQIELLHNYFLDDLEIIVPFSGNCGIYRLTLTGTLKQIVIKWNYSSQYPFQMINLQLNTDSLNLLQREKFNNIQRQIRQRNQDIINKNKLHNSIPKFQIFKNEGSTNSNKSEDHLYTNLLYIFEVATAFYDELIIPYVQQEVDNQIQANRMENSVRQAEQDRQALQQIRNQIFYLRDFHEDPDTTQLLNRNDQQVQPTVQYTRGRYHAQFEQIQQIGEGGFGKVYKVRNKLDSNIYAAKKIVINYQDSKQKKLIKQVGLLSKLNHPNIVRYHQSWLEDATCMEQLINDMSIAGQTQRNQLFSVYNQWKNDQHGVIRFDLEEDQSDQDDNIVFGYAEQSIGYAENSNIIFERQSESNRELTQIAEHLNQRTSTFQFPFKILYIVMEFCQGITLKQFIAKAAKEDDQRKVQIVRGILEGLTYIHNKRIIHRDLKPANIFLDLQRRKPKIGDFGLATTSNMINVNMGQEKSMSLPFDLDLTEKTKGVGTKHYRAPEQMKLGKYDEKVDMYSLGIIMFEMWYPFDTMMQRNQKLVQITRTHKLPKDFYKWGARKTEVQEQIQSLISEQPEERPAAQKLLQAFRNKYFTQLVSCIANPKHFQFYQLLKHLFNIRNQSVHVMRRDLYKNYVVGQLTRIYEHHRGVLYPSIPLVPVIDFQILNGARIPESRRQKFLLLSEKGVLLQYSSNSFNSWFKMAKETFKRKKIKVHQFEDQELRRYTFQRVVQYNPISKQKKSQYAFREKFITGFDIAYPLDSGLNYFHFIEMLKISLEIIETQNLTQLVPPIYICHSKVYICLAKIHKLPLEKLYSVLLSTSEEKFAQLPLNQKIQCFQKSNIDLISAKKICNLLEIEFETAQQWLQQFKTHGSEFSEIEQQINGLTRYFSLYGKILNFPKICWKLQIPPNNSNGLFWTNGPIKGFTSLQQISSDTQMCNIHLQMTLLPGQNEPDVSIWCNGQYLQQEIMKILQRCWSQGVKAKWYDQSIGEKDESCRHNIIIRKKIDRVYISLRNNLQKKETSYISRDQFNMNVIGSLKSKKSYKGVQNSVPYQIS